MKLEWPPEKTFDYPFKEKDELNLEIPLVEDKSKKKQNSKKEEKEQR